jgi:hypothetical protein
MIKLRQVEEKDLLPLAEILPRGFPFTTKEFWTARFEMWWAGNPAYTPQFPRGWVLENDSALVGFIGNIPVKFRIRGEEKIAAASSSWFVDPSIRGMSSLRLFNEFLHQKSVSLFLFKAEDEQLMQFLSRYHFEEHILPKSRKEYVYILNKKNVHFIFSKFIFSKNIPKIADLPELYKRSWFLLLGYILQRPVARPDDPASDEFVSSLCTSCDDTFLPVCEPYLKSCEIALSHDTKTIKWLYFSKARWFERVVIQCRRSRDDHLAGYMVFDFERNKTSEPGNMRLMEMFIADDNPGVLASLTACAIETGKKKNAALLVVFANTRETETYFNKTFFLRRAARHYRYIKFSDIPGMRPVGESHGYVCPSLIYPPQ